MNSIVTKRRARLISRYAQSLSAKDQERLLDLLKKKALIEKTKKLKGKVKANSITMDDILKEIEPVRSSLNG